MARFWIWLPILAARYVRWRVISTPFLTPKGVFYCPESRFNATIRYTAHYINVDFLAKKWKRERKRPFATGWFSGIRIHPLLPFFFLGRRIPEFLEKLENLEELEKLEFLENPEDLEILVIPGGFGGRGRSLGGRGRRSCRGRRR